MIVNGNAVMPPAAPSVSASPASGGNATGFDALLGNQGGQPSGVVSGIQTTLPNGKELGMYTVSLAASAASAGSGAASATPATPTQQQQKADQAMLATFKQMAAYFGQNVTAENTTLEGTAALDLTL